MRLFLALEVPEPVRAGLVELRARLEPGSPGWRWVRAEAIHLTIRFLGEVDVETDRRSRETWRASAASVRPFDLQLTELACFPNPRRPRVLTLGIAETGDGDRLGQLARCIEGEARGLGFELERRPFLPHLTLGRALRGRRPSLPRDTRVAHGDPFHVDRLQLVRSRLEPGGAIYSTLESFSFCG